MVHCAMFSLRVVTAGLVIWGLGPLAEALIVWLKFWSIFHVAGFSPATALVRMFSILLV